jgi:hypothetical protein
MRIAFLGTLLVLLSSSALLGQIPSFEPVQPELFSAPGAQPVAVADFDGDGHLDIFVGFRDRRNRLYRNNGDGTFIDVAQAAGIADPQDTRAAAWGDLNGDGLPDPYVGFTAGSAIPNRLYRNDGLVDIYVTTFLGDVVDARDQLYGNAGGSFIDVLPENIANNDGSHGVQWLETNGNGALDLVLANNHPEGTHYLFRNLLPPDRARRSLQVLVQDREGGLTRAGSEVRLYRAGTRVLLGTGLVDTGGGYASRSIVPVHLGLGEYEGRVDVEVTFLTGAGRQITRVQGVEPRSLVGAPLIVREGAH